MESTRTRDSDFIAFKKDIIMKDCFFTLGGGHFWEDLFVYNDWRIQRNLTSKRCRLLDSHDIVRDEGSFERCFQEWKKYKKALDMPFLGKHIIICLHSYGRTRKIFNELLKAAKLKDVAAEAIGYPSMQRNINEQVKQLKKILQNMNGAEKISFVTYGSGNILLEHLLANLNKEVPSFKLGHIVEVAPWVKGSRLFNELCNFKLAGFVLGAMAKDLSDKNFNKLHLIPKAAIGVIIPLHRKFLSSVWGRFRLTADKHTAVSFCGAKALIQAQLKLCRPLDKKEINEQILQFIKTGKFSKI